LLHTNIALMSINPALYGKMSFAPMKDLTPIVQLVNLPLAVMVRADSPFNSMKDLVDFARANPGKLNFGSGGNGGVPHLALELLNSSYNLKITHVPYKGSSDAVKDLLGGPIDVMCDAISVGLSQVKAGKLKALAVTTESRHPALPDTPTTAEAGYPKFQVTGWQGWVAPAGTPRAILDRVNAETNKAMNDPATRAKLFEQGYLPAGGSVDAFAKQLAADQVKWAELVKVSGARID
ncbi:MAG: tripartite tricarboxylate transporter substrate binding protein, partial [Burkholderiales bacterium]|nr:tripartite tricarboxylate transporter substrate binding protein [Burkholderiales bacterium]